MDATLRLIFRFFAGLFLIGMLMMVLSRERRRPLLHTTTVEASSDNIPPGAAGLSLVAASVAAVEPEEGILYLKATSHSKPYVRIYIDTLTAESILIALTGTAPSRPLPHDLFLASLREFGGRVVSADVVSLEDGIFRASLTMKKDDLVFYLDARVSDAVAIALRAHAPIRIGADILDEAGFAFPTALPPGKASPADIVPGSERVF